LKKTIMLLSVLFVLVLATSALATIPGLGNIIPEYNLDLNNISPEVAVIPAPIPGTLLLLGSALASLAGIRLLRRS
jgi:hypothetical protein